MVPRTSPSQVGETFGLLRLTARVTSSLAAARLTPADIVSLQMGDGSAGRCQPVAWLLEVFTDRISIRISIWSWINAGYGSDFIVLIDMDMDNGYRYSELDLHNYKNDSSNILKSYKLQF